MDESREARIAQLEDQLRQTHPSYEEISGTLPVDPLARVAALATVLQLDAAKAMKADFPLDALMADREDRRAVVKESTALFKEQGMPFAIDVEER